MVRPENLGQTHEVPQFDAEQLLHASKEALNAAVAILYPEEDPNINPLDVLPSPSERRDDAPDIELTKEQEIALRETAAELGFGRQADKKASELGLDSGHVAFLEGGQAHKVLAELGNALDDESAVPGSIVVGASPYRRIKSTNPKADKEVASIKYQLGIPDYEEIDSDEYEITKKIISAAPGFEEAEPATLPWGYDIHSQNTVFEEPTGHFVRIGKIGQTDVVIMSIDREEYVDEEGKSKYRKQPGADGIMGILDNVLSMSGDDSALAFHTSSTYEASRNVDGVSTMLKTNRQVVVATFGTERLSTVKGESDTLAPINQLPGELHKMAKQIQELESLLNPEES